MYIYIYVVLISIRGASHEALAWENEQMQSVNRVDIIIINFHESIERLIGASHSGTFGTNRVFNALTTCVSVFFFCV